MKNRFQRYGLKSCRRRVFCFSGGYVAAGLFQPLLGLPTAFLGASSGGSCLNPSFWMPSFDFSLQWRCRGFIVTGLSSRHPLSFPTALLGLSDCASSVRRKYPGGSGGQRPPVIPRVSDRRARTPLFALFGERENGKVIHGRAHTGVLEIQGLQECL